MSTYLYEAEVFRQPRNPKYYRSIPNLLYPDTATHISDILAQLHTHSYISSKQRTYLEPNLQTAKSRYFYLLPKIHKPRPAWPHPLYPAGRPIVSDVDTESSRICEYIDYYLQPLSTLHPAYIKDTYHFVDKIRNTPIDPPGYLLQRMWNLYILIWN